MKFMQAIREARQQLTKGGVVIDSLQFAFVKANPRPWPFEPLPADLRKQILTRLKDGANTPEIQAETGVSSATIRRIAKAAGLQRRPGAPPKMDAQIRRCLELHNSGLSISEIAYKTGLEESTICVYLRRGLKRINVT